MSCMCGYHPVFLVSAKTISLVAEIASLVTRIDAAGITRDARFRKANRVKSIQSSLQIEANSLKIDQVTAIFEGECVIGPAKDILEVNNAIRAYNLIPCLDPYSKGDLLRAHGAMMEDLTESPVCSGPQGST